MLKTYKQLQDEAELLGIKQNQSTEKLVAAIAEATSVEAVARITKACKEDENKMLTFYQEKVKQKDTEIKTLTRSIAEVNEINTRLGETAGGSPADVDTAIEKITELLDAQLADKEVYTDVYKTGLANAFKLAIAAVRGEDVAEDDLIKPITQSTIKGAPVLSGRQRLIKEAGKFVTTASGTARLRSGLTSAQIEEADEIMERLGVEKGKYQIPAE